MRSGCNNGDTYKKGITLYDIYTEMLDAGKDMTGIDQYVKSWYKASRDRSSWPEIKLVTPPILFDNAVEYAKWLGVNDEDLHNFSGYSFDSSAMKSVYRVSDGRSSIKTINSERRERVTAFFENVTNIISLVENSKTSLNSTGKSVKVSEISTQDQNIKSKHQQSVGNRLVPEQTGASLAKKGPREGEVERTKGGKSTVQVEKNTTVKIYLFGTGGRRARSIFHTGHLQSYGTGKISYVLEQRDDCTSRHNEIVLPQDTPCLAVNHFANRKCSFDRMTDHYSTCKTMLTNDETCRDKRYDARVYYSSAISDKAYLPLGPRYDSWEALVTLMNQRSMRLPSSKRKYAFNAIFSENTSTGRASLKKVIQNAGDSLSSFVQISPKWSGNPNSASNSLANTTTYMRTLFDSAFTLSPAGHNPECFRLYESVEAGSIPVISLDKEYKQHACKEDSLFHWIDSPIVIVESWNELVPTLQGMLANPEELDKRQEDLRAWYNQQH